MVSTVIPVPPFDLVIFGATGDLAHRKILPSLFRRMAVHQMPPGSRVIGAARSKMNRADFRKAVRAALTEFVEPKLLQPALVEEFLNCVDYVPIDAAGEAGWSQLAKKLDEKPQNVRAFDLSVAPQLFAPIAQRLSQAGIATPESRIVVEKPLGHDLASPAAAIRPGDTRGPGAACRARQPTPVRPAGASDRGAGGPAAGRRGAPGRTHRAWQ
jgi:glucose-6-phosphate 1-dehydrogenase